MEYVEISAKESEANGITDKEKNEFFKLYTKLSPKIKKFVGRKKNGKLIKSNFDSLLKAMRELNEL